MARTSPDLPRMRGEAIRTRSIACFAGDGPNRTLTEDPNAQCSFVEADFGTVEQHFDPLDVCRADKADGVDGSCVNRRRNAP